MGNFFLEKGLVISRRGELLEYSARTNEELYFEEPETGRRETIFLDEFWNEHHTHQISIVKAFSSPKLLLTGNVREETPFKNLADIAEHYQEDTHRRQSYISKLLEAGITIGQKRLIEIEVKRIAQEINDASGAPSVSTVCRWWRAFKAQDYEIAGLISQNTDRKHQVRVDDESEQFLQEKIELHYLVNTRPSIAHAYNRYQDELTAENKCREACGIKNLQLVSYRTYYDRIQALPKYDVMVARYGREAARHHFKMIKGHLPADYPLDAVEIDHTPLNLYVIDDIEFLPLGRPWLTVIRDRYTGILLGFYVSFQPTGLGSIFGAIKHSLHAHHKAYELWPELENPWPAHGRGVLYVSDRGADFTSLRYRTAITSLGAKYEYCERRTPWLKGSVERFFLTLEQTFFEAMPGRIFSSLAKRGDYDPVKQAVIRFSTLIFLLHKWAADYHNVEKNSRKKASPLELWNEGIGMAPPPYPANVDELNIILGARHSGVLSQEGIRFKWLNYANEELSDLMKKIGKGQKVDYVVTLEDLGYINVKHPNYVSYLKVPCTRLEYANGLHLFQHQYLLAEAAVSMKASTAVDVLMNTRNTMAAVIAEDVLKKENNTKARLAGTARLAGINSNATLEGKQLSVKTPFQGQQIDVIPSLIIETESPITNIRHFAWGA